VTSAVKAEIGKEILKKYHVFKPKRGRADLSRGGIGRASIEELPTSDIETIVTELVFASQAKSKRERIRKKPIHALMLISTLSKENELKFSNQQPCSSKRIFTRNVVYSSKK
jgi:hypothetical protein